MELIVWLIIIFVIVTIGSILLLFSRSLHLFVEKKTFRRKIGKKVYQIAKDCDLFVLHNIVLKIDNKIIHYDHLLFSNKFIYCIGDGYYQTGLSGKFLDKKWFLYDLKGKFTHINNPMMMQRLRVDYLRGSLGASDDLFVSVVVVNDSCVIDAIEGCPDRNLIVKSSNLVKCIKNYEKNSDLPQLNQEQLQIVVKNIYNKAKKEQLEQGS